LVALVACAGACDAQVTPEYRGEPLLALRGNIVADRSSAPADAALLWWSARPESGAAGPSLATGIPTSKDFPALFTLSVDRLPPDEALFPLPDASGPTLDVPGFPDERLVCRGAADVSASPDAARVAVAYVAAVRRDSPPDQLTANLLGLASDFALVFVPASLDTSAGGPTFLIPASGSVLSPGYHLMWVETLDPGADAPGALECEGPGAVPLLVRLHECAEGLGGTQIQIRLRAG
jgi:hypothetical protein